MKSNMLLRLLPLMIPVILKEIKSALEKAIKDPELENEVLEVVDELYDVIAKLVK